MFNKFSLIFCDVILTSINQTDPRVEFKPKFLFHFQNNFIANLKNLKKFIAITASFLLQFFFLCYILLFFNNGFHYCGL